MRIIRILITLALLGLSYNSFAQCAYGIPPPCVPASAPGWGGGGGGNAPSAPQQRWVYTWGAIAVGSGIGGVSTGMDSKRKAENTAIKDCNNRGGTNCKAVISYHRQCAAFAAGKHGFSVTSGPDLETEKSRVLQRCQALGVDGQCSVVYSNCTEPYLVR